MDLKYEPDQEVKEKPRVVSRCEQLEKKISDTYMTYILLGKQKNIIHTSTRRYQ